MVAITIARAPETTPSANQFFRERTTGTYPPLATATLAPFKCGSWLGCRYHAQAQAQRR